MIQSPCQARTAINAGYRLPVKHTEKDGINLITKERKRQITEEGWTHEHDDKHTDNELARAGAVYALPARFRFYAQAFPNKWDFKPVPADRVKELAKAGALIAAEIDRLLRKASRQG